MQEDDHYFILMTLIRHFQWCWNLLAGKSAASIPFTNNTVGHHEPTEESPAGTAAEPFIFAASRWLVIAANEYADGFIQAAIVADMPSGEVNGTDDGGAVLGGVPARQTAGADLRARRLCTSLRAG